MQADNLSEVGSAPSRGNNGVPIRRTGVVATLLALTVGVAIGGYAHSYVPGDFNPRDLIPEIPTITIGRVAPSAPVVLAAPASTGEAADLQSALVVVAQKTGPSVVSIRTDGGIGSGVIYDTTGLILTNAHVVGDSRTVVVGLDDGRRVSGKVLGADPGFDVAVIKIDEKDLTVAPLGNSSTLQVGQLAVAIGNPYGLDHTVTTGVVSALNRPVSEGQDSYAQPMIQTDVAINPGNSGGPLMDLDGKIIGINTLVAAPMGLPAQGLGFAVPIDTAKRIAPQLVADGRVTKSGQPYIGVGLTQTNEIARIPFMRQRPSPNQTPAINRGTVIGRIEPNGPAANAGLKAGDVVTQFNNREIYGNDDFLQVLVLQHPGDQVSVGITRDGQAQTMTLTIGEAPPR